MNEYPSVSDYKQAVQHPERVFLAPDLQRAVFPKHPTLGIPTPATGSTAAVFQAQVDGKHEALRFFTREDRGGRERYSALKNHLAHGTISGWIANSSWQDGVIRVRDKNWPMVRMEWVEGRTLDRYVGHLVDDGNRDALAALAKAWRDLMFGMQSDRFAHGDLQHGNVLVDLQGRLRLVDLDAVWVDELAGFTAPNESGHPNYQRKDFAWGQRMDTFPGLVIYLSLRLLAHNPQPWHTLHNDDNLLFTREDFDRPSSTPTWALLSTVHDPGLIKLTEQLRSACQPSWRPVDDLEALLVRAGEQPTRNVRPWWVQTAGSTREKNSPIESVWAQKQTQTQVKVETLPPPPPKEPLAPAGQTSRRGRRATPPWQPGASQLGPNGARAGSEYWANRPGPERPKQGPSAAGQPTASSKPAGTQKASARDGRHWKSLSIAAVVASVMGACVTHAAPAGAAGLAFTATFCCIGFLTYLIGLAIFASRRSPGS